MSVHCKFYRAGAALLAITLVLCAAPAFAQSNIGSATAVTNIVQGVRADVTRTLSVGSGVFSDDTVKTGNDSLGQFLFIDQTRFTVAANSQTVLSLVYHPQQGTSDLIMRNVIGAFRYVSGIQTALQKRLEFPFGYITVRGTIIDLLVWPDRAVIILEEGAVTVVPYATQRPYDLSTPGTYLTVFADGRVVGPTPLNVFNINGQVPSFPWQTQLQAFNPDKNLNDILAGLSDSFLVDPTGLALSVFPVAADLLTSSVVRDEYTQSGCLQSFPPYGPSSHVLTRETSTPCSFGASGSQSFTGGAFLGYSRQFNDFVAGIEGDFAWKRFSASNSETVISTAAYGPSCFAVGCVPSGPYPAQRTESFSGQIGQDWDASFRVRFGTVVTPSTLLYLTGGPAVGSVSGAFSYSSIFNLCGHGKPPSGTCSTPADLKNYLELSQSTTGAASWDETRLGWTIGAGVETEVTPRWKLRVEYRYTDFGSISHDVPLTERCRDLTGGSTCSGTAPGLFVPEPETSPPFVAIVQHSAFQTIRVGLSYDFGGFDVGGFLGDSGD